MTDARAVDSRPGRAAGPVGAGADADFYERIRAELYTAVIGDVLDGLGRTHQFLPPTIRPLLPDMTVVGRAMPVVVGTVHGPQRKPFGHLTEALDQLQPGEVYLAPRTIAKAAMWGEILTATAQQRGAAGAVVDGFHRDTAQVLRRGGFPVFSHGCYGLDSSVRTAVREYRVPVEIGGVVVSPGDLVVGDIDGVLVVPQDVEAEVIERAMAKVATENVVLREIERGMSATEAFATYGVL